MLCPTFQNLTCHCVVLCHVPQSVLGYEDYAMEDPSSDNDIVDEY